MEKKLVETKQLLELRKKLKAKKPHFVRQDAHKKARLGTSYRKPKGRHNKMRLGLKGYKKRISIGYKSPKAIRYLSRRGLAAVLICSVKELAKIDPKKQGALIARTVGIRKKIDIVKLCQQKAIQILNIKNPKEFLETVEKRLVKKKEEKEIKQKEKEVKKEKAKKEVKKPTIEEAVTEEEKKAKEKQEKDKLLTQKG